MYINRKSCFLPSAERTFAQLARRFVALAVKSHPPQSFHLTPWLASLGPKHPKMICHNLHCFRASKRLTIMTNRPAQVSLCIAEERSIARAAGLPDNAAIELRDTGLEAS